MTIAIPVPPAGPLRRIGLGTFASGIGNGAWFTTWAIFLTREVGLSPAQVGLGMTATGALAIVAAPPIGRLAERIGPRTVCAVLLTVQALAAAGYLLVGGLAALLVISGLGALAGDGAGGARTALLVGLARPGEGRVALGAQRAVSHVGWGVGAGLGALVLALDTETAYRTAVGLNACSYLV